MSLRRTLAHIFVNLRKPLGLNAKSLFSQLGSEVADPPCVVNEIRFVEIAFPKSLIDFCPKGKLKQKVRDGLHVVLVPFFFISPFHGVIALRPFCGRCLKNKPLEIARVLSPLGYGVGDYRNQTPNECSKQCIQTRFHKISSRKRFGVVLYRYARRRKPARKAVQKRASGFKKEKP